MQPIEKKYKMEPSIIQYARGLSAGLWAYYVQSQGDAGAVYNRLVRDGRINEVIELAKAVFQDPSAWRGVDALRDKTVTLRLGDGTKVQKHTVELLARCNEVVGMVLNGKIDLSQNDVEVNLGIPELDANTLDIIHDCQYGQRSILSYSLEDILKVAIAAKALGITNFNKELLTYINSHLEELVEYPTSIAHLLQQWGQEPVLDSPKLTERLLQLMWSSLPQTALFAIAESMPPEELQGMPYEVIVNQLNKGKIRLSQLFKTSEEAIQFASKHELKRIDLRGFYIETERVEQLLRMNESLKHLKELFLIGMGGLGLIPDSLYQQLIERAPNLQILNMTVCKDMSEQTILSIAKNLPHLRELCLHDGREAVTDTVALLISERLQYLEILSLSGARISDTGLGYIVKRLKIKELNISRCRHITDRGIQVLAESCPNLNKLDFSWCGDGITEQAGLLIAEHLTKLTFLDLSDNEFFPVNHVTDQVVERIAERLPGLEFLGLRSCTGLRNQAVRHIGRLSNLVDLFLDGCSNISDFGVQPIIENLSKLRKLGLGYTNINNSQTFINIADKLKNLEELNLKNLRSISVNTLVYLIKNLPHLSRLLLPFLSYEFYDIVRAHQQQFPQLDFDLGVEGRQN